MEKWKFSKEEYEKLMAFLGYGNFPEADIIIFGNEEGTGGYSIEANVKARCNSYGKDKDGTYIYSLGVNDWTKGYWELEKEGERQKIEKHILPQEIVQKGGFTSGGFLPAAARICLALEGGVQNIDYWFQSYGSNPEARDQIKAYIIQKLFKKQEGIQSALVDWCPLPRPNMSVWPEEYANVRPSSENNPYLNAFQKPKRIRNDNITDFSDFNKDVQNRANLIKSLFEKTSSKVVIGFGGANGFKKEVIEKMFGNGIFEPLNLESVDVHRSMYQAKISTEQKNLHIFLLPFPSAGLVFRNQEQLLDVLKEITVRFIYPIIVE